MFTAERIFPSVSSSLNTLAFPAIIYSATDSPKDSCAIVGIIPQSVPFIQGMTSDRNPIPSMGRFVRTMGKRPALSRLAVCQAKIIKSAGWLWTQIRKRHLTHTNAMINLLGPTFALCVVLSRNVTWYGLMPSRKYGSFILPSKR